MPNRFTIDPSRADEFIDDLSAVENSLHDVAFKWKTTIGALSLFLASPEGLAIVAAAEIATAVHIRLQAQAMLVDVAQSMVYIVREYSAEERRIPFNNDLKSIKLVEMRRANARRAGHLLFRLAHYTPAPIRSYTVRPVVEESDQTCGMLKRPLEHGEARDIQVPPSTPTMSESASEIVVHVGAANTPLLDTPVNNKPPLGHGEADDISWSPTPSVAAFATPFEVAVPLTTSACACHDHLRACEDGRGLSSGDLPKRPFERRAANVNESTPVPPVGGSATTGVLNPAEMSAPSFTLTPTTTSPESARDIVEHVGAANASTGNQDDVLFSLASPTTIASMPAMIVAPPSPIPRSPVLSVASSPGASLLHSGP